MFLKSLPHSEILLSFKKQDYFIFSSQSSAAKISSLSSHCHSASIMCGRYTGRRQIPKQIPEREIKISSSGKGDSLDWLCAVSFSLPKKMWVFFCFGSLILAAHVENRTQEITACTRDNTSAFCPRRMWPNQISEKRMLFFLYWQLEKNRKWYLTFIATLTCNLICSW